MKIAIKQGVPTGLEELEQTEWNEIGSDLLSAQETNPFADLGSNTETSTSTPDEREPLDEQLDGDDQLRDSDRDKSWELSLREQIVAIPGIGAKTAEKIIKNIKN